MHHEDLHLRVPSLALAVSVTLLALAPEASAPSGGIYSLTWSTFDSGGATFSAGEAYRLGGTIGQPDAGPLVGGVYGFSGGFWYATQQVTGVDDALPKTFRLLAGRPNPFTSGMSLGFELPEPSGVRVEVFDLMGKRVRQLADGRLPAGRHNIVWSGDDATGRPAPDGIYFVRVKAGRATGTAKVIKAR